MFGKVLGSTVVALGVAASSLLVVTEAQADSFGLPNHQRVWATDSGWRASVASTDERVTRVPGLTGVGTTREVFVTLRAKATLTPASANAGAVAGKLQNGYMVACSVSLQGIAPSLGGNAGIGGGGGTSGPIPNWNVGPQVGINAGISVTLAPGQVQTVLLDEKEFTSGIASTVSREAQLNVDGCAGPVSMRSFAKLTVATAEANDSNAVYGRVFSP
ncbi:MULTISPECIES: MspA family porin [Bacillati]|uniref:MspA family porin n=1 Tax=Bacillus cereus TaxID=1396 RepID=UPI00362750A5